MEYRILEDIQGFYLGLQKKEIKLTSEIENLIDELPQASYQRVDEIVLILEGILSEIECKLPTEDDYKKAYECLNISRAKDIIVLIKAWNESNKNLNTNEVVIKNNEIDINIINKLAKELKIMFQQIPLVNTAFNKDSLSEF